MDSGNSSESRNAALWIKTGKKGRCNEAEKGLAQCPTPWLDSRPPLRGNFSNFLPLNQMAVALRLRREGTKDRPYYRVVAADNRARRDGRYIEIVGSYDPMKEKDNSEIDLEKVDKWLSNGAQPSDTVRSLIKTARKTATDA